MKFHIDAVIEFPEEVDEEEELNKIEDALKNAVTYSVKGHYCDHESNEPNEPCEVTHIREK